MGSPLPKDFRLVTTNDNQQVSSISTANPGVVQTGGAHGWASGDQVQFLFATVVNAGFAPLLKARLFKITVTDSTHFSLADPITLATIDGSTLGWSAPAAKTVIGVRMLALGTPYTAGSWSGVRKVQAEKQAILLQGSFQPQNLAVTTLPTASAFGTFSLAPAVFTDGPYLDAPTDGSFLTPTITPISQGMLPATANWTGVAWNGTNLFVAIASGGTQAASSPDGITWTSRTLPTSSNWSAVTWSGTVFCAIASGGTAAATSADGITWTARTLPASAAWSAIAWSASLALFVTVASGGPQAASSADGITWASRTLPTSQTWNGVAWNGTVFLAINHDIINVANLPFLYTFATSSNGTSWTTRTFTIPYQGFTAQPLFTALAWNGSVFCLLANNTVATSPDGINYAQVAGLQALSWSAIAWNGSVFCAVASSTSIAATSPDGITWAQQALPVTAGWDAIIAGGSTFCIVGSSSNIALTSTFANFFFSASSLNSINAGQGFLSGDVGRPIRLLSQPALWFTGTPYVAGNAVTFNGLYYIAIASTTGNQPDISPTKWAISSAAATWTWGTIQTITNLSTVTVAIKGPALLYTTTPITLWRLGVYSNTTGWPTCCTYYQGPLLLSRAAPSRVDPSDA